LREKKGEEEPPTNIQKKSFYFLSSSHSIMRRLRLKSQRSLFKSGLKKEGNKNVLMPIPIIRRTING